MESPEIDIEKCGVKAEHAETLNKACSAKGCNELTRFKYCIDHEPFYEKQFVRCDKCREMIKFYPKDYFTLAQTEEVFGITCQKCGNTVYVGQDVEFYDGASSCGYSWFVCEKNDIIKCIDCGVYTNFGWSNNKCFECGSENKGD